MAFTRQFRALVRKNLLVAVVRRPFGFIFSIVAFPLILLSLLLSIPIFLRSTSKNGISSPASLPNLADTITKKIVIVKPEGLGADVDRVIEEFTKPIDDRLLQFVDNEDALGSLCMANLRGVSDCHASVTFFDSPETSIIVKEKLKGYTQTSRNHTWNYVISIDPVRLHGRYDATGHNGNQERVTMPLALAINNAITNSTSDPEVFTYTELEQAVQDREQELYIVFITAQTFIFALFICHFTIIYRHTALITSERESGMSQLVDAMGGNSTVISRVLSWLLVFDLYTLPVYITFGGLYWHLMFPTSSLGLLVGWQILQGLAVNSSTVFAAAFFTKSRVSAIYVIGAFLLVSVGAQIYSFQIKPSLPQPVGAYALSLLFPSSNHVFFAQQMALWELSGSSAKISKQPLPLAGINSHSYKLTQSTMLIFLIISIFVYPVLAIIVEKYMHGINFRDRALSDEFSEPSGVIAETLDLQKKFVPNFLERIFCCGKRRPVKAVDGVSLQGHKGQILCLVGPNGSGKTTTLHMMSGFISPTAGSVKFGVAASKVGICPQRNTFWAELTVKEHVSIWGAIKSSHETPQEIDTLIAGCDLELKRDCQSRMLSGGQQRKLQLACMFVGGSSVCLIDECTSGLDPLSRRVIWEILLQQRAKRSIIFTTHFLDEVDVLADHIVILTKGKVKCQGAAAELKHIYGGGYRVIVPLHAATPSDIQYDFVEHQDTRIYSTPNSQSASQLSSHLSANGVEDITISGPEVEDVFLRVADDGDLDVYKNTTKATESNFEMTPGDILPFWGQVRVLFRKRFTVLRRFWWPYLYVLALPIVITPFFNRLMIEYEAPSCDNLASSIWTPTPISFFYSDYCTKQPEMCEQLVIGPTYANEVLHDIWEEKQWNFKYVDKYESFVVPVDDRERFLDWVDINRHKAAGGVYLGSANESAVVAYLTTTFENGGGISMLNVLGQMTSGLEIVSSVRTFAETRDVSYQSLQRFK